MSQKKQKSSGAGLGCSYKSCTAVSECFVTRVFSFVEESRQDMKLAGMSFAEKAIGITIQSYLLPPLFPVFFLQIYTTYFFDIEVIPHMMGIWVMPDTSIFSSINFLSMSVTFTLHMERFKVSRKINFFAYPFTL
jgi:hypothetical protein